MGFLEDIGNFFSNAGQEVSKTFTHMQSELQNLGRGDIGAFIGKTGTSVYRTMKTPIEVASDLARGDIKNAQKNLATGVGAAMNQSAAFYGGVLQPLGESKVGQRVLDAKPVDKYTFGLSGDFAGTLRAGNDLESGGSTSQENIDDTFRFGTKIAGIGAGTMAYHAYQSATAVGGSAIPGYLSVAKDTALGVGAAKSLANGDVKGAVNQVGQISGDYSDLFPQFPSLPSAPDWFPDLGNLWDDYFGGQPKPPQGPAPSLWGSSPASSVGGISAPKAAGVSLLAVLAVVGAVYMMKKKG